MEEAFVLDGSVALAWYFADEADPYANAVAGCLPTARAYVPALWHLEVANAIVMGERRKRSTPAQAFRWIQALRSLPITVDSETVEQAWSDTLEFARKFDLSAYDAAYLELAMRKGLPLATLDKPLKAAAKAAGVALFKP